MRVLVCNTYRDTQPQDSKLSRLLWCGRMEFKFPSSAVSQRLSGPSPLIHRKGNNETSLAVHWKTPCFHHKGHRFDTGSGIKYLTCHIVQQRKRQPVKQNVFGA